MTSYCWKHKEYGSSDYCYNVCKHAEECAKRSGKRHSSLPVTLEDKIQAMKRRKSKIVREPNFEPIKTPDVPVNIQNRMNWINL
jgi:hypothetical protein